ncbi:MAG: EAL domain-containing protein, partial [Nostoc sp.]
IWLLFLFSQSDRRGLSDLQVAMLQTLPTREFVPLLKKPKEFEQHKSKLPERREKIKQLINELQRSPQTTATKDLDRLCVTVTAEGLETAEQLALLRAMKCEYGQGNFFSKPLDSSTAEALIVANRQW